MNFRIKSLYFIFCFLNTFTENFGLIPQLNIKDNPALLKTFLSVHTAGSEVTTNLLKRLCSYLREKIIKQKIFKCETNLLLTDDEAEQESDIKFYKNMYNSACKNLHQEPNDNNTIIMKEDEETVLNQDLQDDILPIKQYQNCTHHPRKKEYRLLYDTLIKGLNNHTYKIQKYPLYKHQVALNSKDQRSVIVIITLHPLSNKSISQLNLYSVIEDAVNESIHKTSLVDIHIIDSMFTDQYESISTVQKCHLYSLYIFLIESGRKNSIKNFKLLRVKGTFKIYINILTNLNLQNFPHHCCNKSLLTLCENRIYSDRNEFVDIDQIKFTTEKQNVENIRSILSKIKNLINLYNAKFIQNHTTVSVTKENEINMQNIVMLPTTNHNLSKASCKVNEINQTQLNVTKLQSYLLTNSPISARNKSFSVLNTLSGLSKEEYIKLKIMENIKNTLTVDNNPAEKPLITNQTFNLAIMKYLTKSKNNTSDTSIKITNVSLENYTTALPIFAAKDIKLQTKIQMLQTTSPMLSIASFKIQKEKPQVDVNKFEPSLTTLFMENKGLMDMTNTISGKPQDENITLHVIKNIENNLIIGHNSTEVFTEKTILPNLTMDLINAKTENKTIVNISITPIQFAISVDLKNYTIPLSAQYSDIDKNTEDLQMFQMESSTLSAVSYMKAEQNKGQMNVNELKPSLTTSSTHPENESIIVPNTINIKSQAHQTIDSFITTNENKTMINHLAMPFQAILPLDLENHTKVIPVSIAKDIKLQNEQILHPSFLSVSHKINEENQRQMETSKSESLTTTSIITCATNNSIKVLNTVKGRLQEEKLKPKIWKNMWNNFTLQDNSTEILKENFMEFSKKDYNTSKLLENKTPSSVITTIVSSVQVLGKNKEQLNSNKILQITDNNEAVTLPSNINNLSKHKLDEVTSIKPVEIKNTENNWLNFSSDRTISGKSISSHIHNFMTTPKSVFYDNRALFKHLNGNNKSDSEITTYFVPTQNLSSQVVTENFGFTKSSNLDKKSKTKRYISLSTLPTLNENYVAETKSNKLVKTATFPNSTRIKNYKILHSLINAIDLEGDSVQHSTSTSTKTLKIEVNNRTILSAKTYKPLSELLIISTTRNQINIATEPNLYSPRSETYSMIKQLNSWTHFTTPETTSNTYHKSTADLFSNKSIRQIKVKHQPKTYIIKPKDSKLTTPIVTAEKVKNKLNKSIISSSKDSLTKHNLNSLQRTTISWNLKKHNTLDLIGNFENKDKLTATKLTSEQSNTKTTNNNIDEEDQRHFISNIESSLSSVTEGNKITNTLTENTFLRKKTVDMPITKDHHKKSKSLKNINESSVKITTAKDFVTDNTNKTTLQENVHEVIKAKSEVTKTNIESTDHISNNYQQKAIKLQSYTSSTQNCSIDNTTPNGIETKPKFITDNNFLNTRKQKVSTRLSILNYYSKNTVMENKSSEKLEVNTTENDHTKIIIKNDIDEHKITPVITSNQTQIYKSLYTTLNKKVSTIGETSHYKNNYQVTARMIPDNVGKQPKFLRTEILKTLSKTSISMKFVPNTEKSIFPTRMFKKFTRTDIPTAMNKPMYTLQKVNKLKLNSTPILQEMTPISINTKSFATVYSTYIPTIQIRKKETLFSTTDSKSGKMDVPSVLLKKNIAYSKVHPTSLTLYKVNDTRPIKIIDKHKVEMISNTSDSLKIDTVTSEKFYPTNNFPKRLETLSAHIKPTKVIKYYSTKVFPSSSPTPHENYQGKTNAKRKENKYTKTLNLMLDSNFSNFKPKIFISVGQDKKDKFYVTKPNNKITYRTHDSNMTFIKLLPETSTQSSDRVIQYPIKDNTSDVSNNTTFSWMKFTSFPKNSTISENPRNITSGESFKKLIIYQDIDITPKMKINIGNMTSLNLNQVATVTKMPIIPFTKYMEAANKLYTERDFRRQIKDSFFTYRIPKVEQSTFFPKDKNSKTLSGDQNFKIYAESSKYFNDSSNASFKISNKQNQSNLTPKMQTSIGSITLPDLDRAASVTIMPIIPFTKNIKTVNEFNTESYISKKIKSSSTYQHIPKVQHAKFFSNDKNSITYADHQNFKEYSQSGKNFNVSVEHTSISTICNNKLTFKPLLSKNTLFISFPQSVPFKVKTDLRSLPLLYTSVPSIHKNILQSSSKFSKISEKSTERVTMVLSSSPTTSGVLYNHSNISKPFQQNNEIHDSTPKYILLSNKKSFLNINEGALPSFITNPIKSNHNSESAGIRSNSSTIETTIKASNNENKNTTIRRSSLVQKKNIIEKNTNNSFKQLLNGTNFISNVSKISIKSTKSLLESGSLTTMATLPTKFTNISFKVSSKIKNSIDKFTSYYNTKTSNNLRVFMTPTTISTTNAILGTHKQYFIQPTSKFIFKSTTSAKPKLSSSSAYDEQNIKLNEHRKVQKRLYQLNKGQKNIYMDVVKSNKPNHTENINETQAQNMINSKFDMITKNLNVNVFTENIHSPTETFITYKHNSKTKYETYTDHLLQALHGQDLNEAKNISKIKKTNVSTDYANFQDISTSKLFLRIPQETTKLISKYNNTYDAKRKQDNGTRKIEFDVSTRKLISEYSHIFSTTIVPTPQQIHHSSSTLYSYSNNTQNLNYTDEKESIKKGNVTNSHKLLTITMPDTDKNEVHVDRSLRNLNLKKLNISTPIAVRQKPIFNSINIEENKNSFNSQNNKTTKCYKYSNIHKSNQELNKENTKKFTLTHIILTKSLESTTRLKGNSKTIKYNTYKPMEEDLEITIKPHIISKYKLIKSRQYKFSITPLPRNKFRKTSHILEKKNDIFYHKTNEGITKNTESKSPLEIKKTNFKKDENKEIIPALEKTNLYPLMKLPPKSHRKVMKRIRLSNNDKEIIAMDSKDFFNGRKLAAKPKVSKFVQKAAINQRIQNIATVKSKHHIIRPVFNKVDGIIKSSREHFKPEPLFFTNNDDFYRKDFMNHHQNDALTLREKVNYIKETFPMLNHNLQQESQYQVIDRPVYLPPLNTKPKILRDRIDYIRSYLYNSEFIKPSQLSIINDVESTTKDKEPYQDPLYYFRRSGWYEDNFEGLTPTTTTTRKPIKRQRRTIFFLSPTIPYNYYF